MGQTYQGYCASAFRPLGSCCSVARVLPSQGVVVVTVTPSDVVGLVAVAVGVLAVAELAVHSAEWGKKIN